MSETPANGAGAPTESSAFALRSVRLTTASLRAARLPAAKPLPSEGESRIVLDDVSLTASAGSVLSILGESGGGKSTLLRLLNRLVEAESGEVEVLGRIASAWPVRDLRRAAVLVHQRPFLFGGTVGQELSLPLQWAHRPMDAGKIDEALELVRLAGIDQSLSAAELSEGQRARLCLARALLLEPKLLLLDEPTGALDVRTSRELLAGLRSWARERGVTLSAVTHRPEDLEALGGEAVVLLGGKIAERASAADLLAGRVGIETSIFLGRGGVEPKDDRAARG